jgi:molybdopterin converting factor small subunit
MRRTVKSLVRILPQGFTEYIRNKKEMHDWKRKGGAYPVPHLIKQEVIKEYARKYSLDTLIETGTYLGTMINAMKDEFAEIISIELDDELFQRAKNRFSRLTHITVLHGDSVDVLPTILSGLCKPCLFWLDGHYSGGITSKGKLETPIVQELTYILEHPIAQHVILVDDAREFNGEQDYPTVERIRNLIQEKRPGWEVEVEMDIIRNHPAFI